MLRQTGLHSTDPRLARTGGLSLEALFPIALGASILLSLIVAGRLLALELEVFTSAVFLEDAFYYLVPAWNWIHEGSLSLDGRNVTNGFHPLWMGVHVALAALAPERWIMPRLAAGAGLALAVIGALLLARRFEDRRVQAFVVALALFGPAAVFWMSGMESGLTFFFLMLLLCTWSRLVLRGSSAWHGLSAGLLLGGLILARLDQVAFGGLLVALSAAAAIRRSREERAAILQRLALAGIAASVVVGTYLSTNWLRFSSLTPVNALAKRHYAAAEERSLDSLLSWSTAYVGQFANFFFRRQFEGTAVIRNALAVALLITVGGLVLAGCIEFGRRRDSWMRDPPRVALILFALLHPLLYAWGLGSFAAVGYYSWYFVPEFAALLFLSGLGLSAVLRSERTFPAALRLALVVLPLALSCASVMVQRSLARTQPNVFVRAAQLLNRLTPPGARCAANSAGTQAFFLTEGRRITNLDGLSNSPAFFHEALLPQKILAFLEDEGVDYLSDYSSNVSASDWTLLNGESIPAERISLLAQARWESDLWYSVARLVRDPMRPSRRRKLEPGEFSLQGFEPEDGPGRARQLPAPGEPSSRVHLKAGSSEIVRAEVELALEAGWHKFSLLYGTVSENPPAIGGAPLELSLRGPDGIVLGASSVPIEELCPFGQGRTIVLYLQLERDFERATLRMEKRAPTLAIVFDGLLHEPMAAGPELAR